MIILGNKNPDVHSVEKENKIKNVIFATNLTYSSIFMPLAHLWQILNFLIILTTFLSPFQHEKVDLTSLGQESHRGKAVQYTWKLSTMGISRSQLTFKPMKVPLSLPSDDKMEWQVICLCLAVFSVYIVF